MSRLGIILLILGFAHLPLPQADFHNIRHHDAPGEVCEHHDHLLRWHPDAGLAEDVAILHWHWIFPFARAMTQPQSGPALHAHVPGETAWPDTTREEKPRVLPDTPSRLLARVTALDAAPLPPPLDRAALERAAVPIVLPCRALTFGATFAPRAALSTLLQRWVC